jgi:hypothetical protein
MAGPPPRSARFVGESAAVIRDDHDDFGGGTELGSVMGEGKEINLTGGSYRSETKSVRGGKPGNPVWWGPGAGVTCRCAVGGRSRMGRGDAIAGPRRARETGSAMEVLAQTLI